MHRAVSRWARSPREAWMVLFLGFSVPLVAQPNVETFCDGLDQCSEDQLEIRFRGDGERASQLEMLRWAPGRAIETEAAIRASSTGVVGFLVRRRERRSIPHHRRGLGHDDRHGRRPQFAECCRRSTAFRCDPGDRGRLHLRRRAVVSRADSAPRGRSERRRPRRLSHAGQPGAGRHADPIRPTASSPRRRGDLDSRSAS